MKAALVVLVLGGTASLAFVQRATELLPARPENVWPTSVAGWLGLVLAGTACWGLWRKRESETIAPVLEKMKTMEEHFDGEVHRMEGLVERTATAVRGAITADINGWGERIKVVERAKEAQDEMNDRWIAHMSESTTDRAAITRQLAALTQTVERMREQTDGKMDRILEALVQLKGGRNQ